MQTVPLRPDDPASQQGSATASSPAPDSPAQPASSRPVDTEIELKLTADPAVLRQVLEAPVVAAWTDGRSVATRHHESVYYDTPDLALHRRGISFRVRRTGHRFVQTLKTDDGWAGSGRVKRRGEWKVPVASLVPDPAAFTAPEARAQFDGVATGALAPVFATRIERQVRVLNGAAPDGTASRIELVLDEGAVESPAGRMPIAELELELLEGPPAALYRLALELHALAPLRLEQHSNAQRGYALAGGAPPTARKAGRLELTGDAAVGAVLGDILRHCLAHWLANELVVLDGRDPEGVHQMRVALRRLRSALTLFRPLIPPGDLEWLRAETKWLAGSLGPARDWDVFLAEMLAPVAAHRPDDADLAALRQTAEARRAAGYAGARAAVLSPRYTALVLRLGVWLEEDGWRAGVSGEAAAQLDAPLQGFADHLLSARHRKVLKAGKGFARLTPPERHQVRIRLKMLRYAVEFFRSLYPGRRFKDYLDALAGLQDTLGHLNDVTVAQHLLAGLADGAPPPDGTATAAGATAEATATPAAAGPAAQGAARDGAASGEIAVGAGLVIGWHSRGLMHLEPKVLADWHDFADAKPFWTVEKR